MSSSNRLSKLSQYLYDGNYEQAVYMYDRKIQCPQTEEEYLLLAKAYYVGEHYGSVLTLLKEIKNARSIPVSFEAKMLKLKAQYLNSSLKPQKIQKVEEWMKQKKSYLNNYHFWCFQQIKSITNSYLSAKKSNFTSREILNDEKNEFMQVYNKYDNLTPIMQGMPVYLISRRWFEQWQQFVSLQSKVSGEYPGPITNFQIVDHIYQGFYDERKQKAYTNHYLFEPCKYKIIPKQCWQFLFQRYGGIQVVRFNISDISRPNQIMGEVYLKKIAIIEKNKYDAQRNGNSFKDVLNYIQISKKQTWKGLIRNKLEKVWGPDGMIFQLQGHDTNKVDLNQFLQDCDTAGKIYLYISNYKEEKIGNKNPSQKCAYKNCSKTQGLKYCQCKSVKYCGMDCLKQDRENHRKKCELQLQHLKQKSAIIQNFNLSEKQYSGRKGIVGLRNLGNTCYMNSGLQCLSNTKEITDYFMSNDFLKHINSTNPLGTKGNLACAYAELMREIWAGKDDVVSPFNLKKMIGKFATQFSGYGQQDSQQFINYLIDGLQEDLNLVKKKQTFEVRDEILPDEEASLESQRNYSKRIQSYIRDLMAGQFKSTVQCRKCKRVSVCFDPFLSVSLPIPSPKFCDFYLLIDDLSHGAIRLYFNISDSTTFKQLDSQIKREYDKNNIKQIIYVRFDKQSFEVTNVITNLNDTIVSHSRESEFLFGYEVPQNNGQYDIYFSQYFYKNSRCGFPRFLKFPKRSWEKNYQGVIEQSLRRVSLKSFDVNVENVRKISPLEPYTKICAKYLVIELKRDIKLLTFKDNRDFQLKCLQRKGITLFDCFSHFSKTQLLINQNQWYCNKCKEFVSAQKQLEIYKSNKILVLTFKRFTRLKKIKEFIDYPVEGFDIGPYLRSNKQKKPILYDLYGVVNHYGSIGGGHYTAYCQNFLNKRWYEFNDSNVSQISKRQIVSESSYVLFFRRRE